MVRSPTWPLWPPTRALATLTLLAALSFAACGDDSAADCHTTYRHLLAVAHRNHTPEAMASFMTACTEHYDPRRLECLREAATPGAALACKPFKKRPD